MRRAPPQLGQPQPGSDHIERHYSHGPIAAALVELFPTRIRYTAMSLPYHVGNGWFGGLLPATAFAISAQTGNPYSGLWYPVVIALATVVISAASSCRRPRT